MTAAPAVATTVVVAGRATVRERALVGFTATERAPARA